ncbi:phosphate signaling complex protein PhoU [Photobacterium sp. DNB22_13_2]
MLDNLSLGRHISGQFNAELESIRTYVLAMGGLVEQQLADALKAMHKQDIELARRVIKDDHKVNAMEVAIDEACTRIIAKRQPTASDLRLVIAIIKTITDLERIGDVAESIAKVALENFTNKQYNLLVSLEALGQSAVRMLHEVLDAFARMDVKAAIEVYQEDDRIDREYEAIIRQLMTYMMEDPRSIPNVLQVMWSARSIERVGDRCQNICEYIIYFVKGKDIRHTSQEEIENILK